MYKLKDYIKLIRYTCIIDNIMYFYFIRIIVLVLLNNNVVTWCAVSIPLVLELARLLSRTITKSLEFSIRVNFKKYHLFYIITFSIISIIITTLSNIYLIYILSLLLGFITGIRRSSILNFNTSNYDYESYLFMEEERSQVIGGTIGLILSQTLFDINYIYYVLFYIVIILLELITSKYTKNIIISNDIKEYKVINNSDKRNIKLLTILFGILASIWYIGTYSFEELAPLISNKIGYLNAMYTMLEFILLFIITNKFIDKIKKKNRLILSITCVALIDLIALFISSSMKNINGLIISYIISSIVSTLGEPLYESILSYYSNNDKNKYILVNKIFYGTRSIFTIISFILCRFIVINNIDYFKYLGVILSVIIFIVYLILDKLNKKILHKGV